MAFTRTNGSGWAVGDKLTSAQANALDIDHANALDKTSAGDTLSGAITVAAGGSMAFSGAGSGITVSNTTGFVNITGNGAKVDASASGALIQASTSGAKIRTVTGGRISLEDNDYILLGASHTGRSRSVMVSCSQIIPSKNTTTVGGFSSSNLESSVSNANPPKMFEWGFQTTAVSATTGQLAYYVLPFRPHNGATINAITLYFVTANHSALPTSTDMLGVGVYSLPIPAAGASGPPSGSLILSVQASGFTLANYQDTTHVKTITASSGSAVVDVSANTYHLVVYDECGPNAVVGNKFIACRVDYTSIADLRPY